MQLNKIKLLRKNNQRIELFILDNKSNVNNLLIKLKYNKLLNIFNNKINKILNNIKININKLLKYYKIIINKILNLIINIKLKSRLNLSLTVFTVLIYFSSLGVDASPRKILIFMSSADMLILNGERKYSTGVFLNEFYLPYKNLKDQDFEIDFATLDGKSAPIDPESLKLKYWDNEKIQQEAIDFTKLNIKFLNPKSIDSLVKPELEYSGIIIPGGQGLMVDLLGNEKVLKLISMFHTKKKSIGLICHAPAILTTYPKESNPFKGYRVNSVTGIEEWFIETFVMKGNPSVRKIASLLEESGLNYEKSLLPGRPFAVKDRNLVSSQNPFSGKEFIDLYNESLNEFK